MKGNVLVAQSGGPSPVINSSLYGVIDECRKNGAEKIYAAYHGIEGVLKEEIADMACEDERELALLKITPAAGAAGTCRYKLTAAQSEDFDRIIDVFAAHDIRWFFYIGGNDSMDTAEKVSQLAAKRGYELVVTGIPKTIDNDVGDAEFKLIDHTPGYGSCARFWAHLIQNAEEENRGMYVSEPVSVYQAMGRTSGFIAAAARLADPDRKMPLQIYTAESGHNIETLAAKVSDQLSRDGRCIVVVNEGFNVGDIGVRRDGFGHIEYGASETSAMQAVVNYLNRNHICARGQATGQLPGVMQRGVSMYASTVDLEEACEVARYGVRIALEHGTGYMATILRCDTADYEPYYSKVPLGVVANSQRFLPQSWLSADKTDVTDDFIRYARPLIGIKNPEIPLESGLQRFARLKMAWIEKRLPAYVPQTLR